METRYTYKRVRLPNGTETYERVPYNPDDVTIEPPVIVPKLSPLFKNGEFPGGGSVVVDSLMAKTEAAKARIELREAQDARAEADRINAQLGRDPVAIKRLPGLRPWGRIVEP